MHTAVWAVGAAAVAGPAALPESPALVVLLGAAAAVGSLLYLRRSPVGRRTVIASLPWVAVGVALHAVRGVVAYPAVFSPVLDPPWVYLLVATLGGLVWVLLGSLVVGTGRRPHYFAAAGFGTLVPPTSALVVYGSVTAPEVLVLWLTVPLVATLVTYVVMLALGLWLPDSGYFAGSAGAVVVFALAVDGIGRALAVGLGRPFAASVGLTRAVDAALLGLVETPFTAVSTAVWFRLAFAVAVIGLLTALARRWPRAAERGLELTTVATVLVAANTFLLALGGGLA